LYRKAYATNGASEATRAQRANASVLKTEGTGWDVGHAVKFLLSDYARYITGQVRVVDGGVTLRGPGRDFASLSPNSGSGQKRKWRQARMRSALTSTTDMMKNAHRMLWDIRKARCIRSTSPAGSSYASDERRLV
jgi:hypothetical protein